MPFHLLQTSFLFVVSVTSEVLIPGKCRLRNFFLVILLKISTDKVTTLKYIKRVFDRNMSMLKLTFYPVVHFVKYNAVRSAVYEFTRNSRSFAVSYLTDAANDFGE